MTPEEKQLLLKDLCARGPYGVKVVYLATTYSIQYVDSKFDEVKLEGMLHTVGIGYIKPYLRPISSMTEEECNEYADTDWFEGLDWLLAHHFDVRFLIGKGLALEAPENMYKPE